MMHKLVKGIPMHNLFWDALYLGNTQRESLFPFFITRTYWNTFERTDRHTNRRTNESYSRTLYISDVYTVTQHSLLHFCLKQHNAANKTEYLKNHIKKPLWGPARTGKRPSILSFQYFPTPPPKLCDTPCMHSSHPLVIENIWRV